MGKTGAMKGGYGNELAHDPDMKVSNKLLQVVVCQAAVVCASAPCQAVCLPDFPLHGDQKLAGPSALLDRQATNIPSA
jgi:hypothetical protein